jgi:hypothetical protein
MLIKLIKYELKATMRIFLPLYAGIVLLAAINFDLVESTRYAEELDWFRGATLAIMILAIITVFIMAFIISIQRFYRNIFGDEGYLTHTLPATSLTLINSKLFVAMFWTFANSLICGLVVWIITGQWFLRIFDELLKQIQPYLSTGNLIELIVISLVLMIIGTWSGLLTYYFAMSLGQLANKNKFTFAVLAYIAISWTSNIITNLVVDIVSSTNLPEWFMNLAPLTQARYTLYGFSIISLLVGLLFLFGTNYLISKKLNLE